MTMLEGILLAINALLLGYVVGLHLSKFVFPPTQETVSKKKVHVPRYNAGNLLEPISPADQRLEKMLTSKGRDNY